ncbi:hypothetical protein Tco_1410556 [Tanacetum coccineum]
MSPLSLAKVVYAANINDWCSLVAVPLGAKCGDVGPSKSSHQVGSSGYRPCLRRQRSRVRCSLLARPEGSFSTFRRTGSNLSTLGPTPMVVESEHDTSSRIGGWVEMNNSGTRHLQWGASISDLPEDDFGWGLRLGGTIEGLKDWDHYQVEGFSKIN